MKGVAAARRSRGYDLILLSGLFEGASIRRARGNIYLSIYLSIYIYIYFYNIRV